MAFHISASRRQLSWLAGAFMALSLLLLLFWHNQERVRQVVSTALHSALEVDGDPECRQLPGGEDVVVVMKTGANEVQDKLSVHLRTTLSCYPNQAIFSDYEEDLPTGEHLYDALKYTTPSIKEIHEDFALYRKLRVEGRSGLDQLSGTDSREIPEEERMKIPGWKLDKWKFLPMLNQTFYLFPDKPWYVFVEADTYLFWSNLLLYLAERSWSSDTVAYIGFRTGIEDVSFAHGGSGFLLSRMALEKVVTEFQNNQAEWEDFTDQYWVGDHILGAAFRKAGVYLKNAAPSWQGDPVGLLQFSPENEYEWCSTVMTVHHESPPEIKDLWKLEQSWISDTAAANQSQSLCRRDLFERFVLPRIDKPKSGWNNKADMLQDQLAASQQECRDSCERDPECMQYAFHIDGNCTTTSKVIYGEPSEGFESGWILQRIQQSFDESKDC